MQKLYKNYYVKEYTYNTREYKSLIGNTMRYWDGNEPYYFFKEISKSLYNFFMERHKDRITTIVWNGVLYEYTNPEDVLKGVFIFRNIYGREYNIDLRGYLSAKKFIKRKVA